MNMKGGLKTACNLPHPSLLKPTAELIHQAALTCCPWGVPNLYPWRWNLDRNQLSTQIPPLQTKPGQHRAPTAHLRLTASHTVAFGSGENFCQVKVEPFSKHLPSLLGLGACDVLLKAGKGSDTRYLAVLCPCQKPAGYIICTAS